MSFTKQQIIQEMKRTGLVPLFTHDNPDDAFQVLKTSYDAGIRTFEFTNRRPNSYEVFCHLNAKRDAFPELMLGIGTVMDAGTTKRFIDAGADYIISPVVKTEMAPVCHAHDKLWIPGCTTLTEIVTAKDHGAEVMKIFPGSILGPAFIHAIMPIVPGLQLMVTGGVEPDEQNLKGWFNAGVMCVGMGSNLFKKDVLERKDWQQLGRTISTTISLIGKVRNNPS